MVHSLIWCSACIDLRRRLWDQGQSALVLGDSNCWEDQINTSMSSLGAFVWQLFRAICAWLKYFSNFRDYSWLFMNHKIPLTFVFNPESMHSAMFSTYTSKGLSNKKMKWILSFKERNEYLLIVFRKLSFVHFCFELSLSKRCLLLVQLLLYKIPPLLKLIQS